MTVEPEISAVEPDVIEPGVIAPTEPTVNEDAAMGEAWDKYQEIEASDEVEGQLRGDDGRFVAALAPVEGEKAHESSLEGEEGAGDIVEGSTATPVSSAPEHLPQALKAEWENMSEVARNEVAKFSTESDRKFGELGNKYRDVKPIADRLSHAVENSPEFAGMTPDQLAQGAVELAAVQTRLTKAPVETIIEIMQHYGVMQEVSQLLTGQQLTPEIQNGVTQERGMAELRQQIASSQITPEQISQQVSDTLEQRETDTTVNGFIESKPLYSDVEAVMPEFVSMARNQQPDAPIIDVLEAAYDMAINAIPSVREKIRASEAATATATDNNLKRTESAKRAASINVKSASSGKGRTLTEDEVLGSTYDNAMAR